MKEKKDNEKKELTKREKQIIKSYDHPHNVDGLAEKLGITTDTFYTHQKNILAKEKLPTMTHVVSRYKKDWAI